MKTITVTSDALYDFLDMTRHANAEACRSLVRLEYALTAAEERMGARGLGDRLQTQLQELRVNLMGSDLEHHFEQILLGKWGSPESADEKAPALVGCQD